jgi:outer membrane protein assembly factor BamD (BamD/ComL family)
MRITAIALFVLAAVFAAFAPSACAEEPADAKTDKIIFKNGDVQSGKVFSAKYDKVTLGGKSFNTTDISKIVWFDSPADYLEALDMIEQGAYDNASFKLKLAADAQGVREWLKLDIQIAQADIHWRKGEWEAARKIYEEVNKNFADSFHLRNTTWRSAVALMKLEKFAEAEAAFEAIGMESALLEGLYS